MITGILSVEDKDFFGDAYMLYREAKYALPKPILDILEPLNYELYFFGSRSKMPIPTDDKVSDWDFAVDSSKYPVLPEIFKLKQPEDNDYEMYTDGFTFEVWEADIEGYQIQVVKKNSFEWFKSVWDNLDNDFYATYINKRSPQYIGKDGVTQLFSSYASLYSSYLNKSYEDML